MTEQTATPKTDRYQSLILARSGDEHAIGEVLRWVVPSIKYRLGLKYYLPHCDDEDVESIVRIAAFEALSSFDPQMGVPFRDYALNCAEYSLIDELKGSQRKMRAIPPGYSLLYLDRKTDDGDEDQHEKVGFPDKNIERVVEPLLSDFSVAKFRSIGLTNLEATALRYYLDGHKYPQICEILNLKRVKQVDNALQRAKRKLKKLLNPS